jgi:hypothetical protein
MPIEFYLHDPRHPADVKAKAQELLDAHSLRGRILQHVRVSHLDHLKARASP